MRATVKKIQFSPLQNECFSNPSHTSSKKCDGSGDGEAVALWIMKWMRAAQCSGAVKARQSAGVLVQCVNRSVVHLVGVFCFVTRLSLCVSF